MDIYLDLIKLGWSLHDIDEMDINYFFRLNAYLEKKETEPTAYIDQIPGF